MNDERFKKKLGISDERFDEISKVLLLEEQNLWRIS
jgi:hypothetical protein